MTALSFWASLVTFERLEEGSNDVLPAWAQGACGWMAALAETEEQAVSVIRRDIESLALRMLETEDTHEASQEEITMLDPHLAANLKSVRDGAQTVWGTLHGYKGEAES